MAKTIFLYECGSSIRDYGVIHYFHFAKGKESRLRHWKMVFLVDPYYLMLSEFPVNKSGQY